MYRSCPASSSVADRRNDAIDHELPGSRIDRGYHPTAQPGEHSGKPLSSRSQIGGGQCLAAERGSSTTRRPVVACAWPLQVLFDGPRLECRVDATGGRRLDRPLSIYPTSRDPITGVGMPPTRHNGGIQANKNTRLAAGSPGSSLSSWR